jgi:hypothetical protein
MYSAILSDSDPRPGGSICAEKKTQVSFEAIGGCMRQLMHDTWKRDCSFSDLGGLF